LDSVRVAVVGAGQAGLATSRELSERGVDHLVLERGRVGQTWRGRWDSFCLVTPNWSVRLPGGAYDGPDPDGYMDRDELVAFLDRYARAIGAPLREGVDVRGIERSDGHFVLRTAGGDLGADQVVLATGAYQLPHRPRGAETLPADVHRLDAEGYSNPSALPPGRVLIVGSGQTGCQIAEELHEAGRDVVLACGRAPWITRRIGGRDAVWWVDRTGFWDQRVETLPDPSARVWANILATGHGGGHDLHLRTLRALGVTLVGHFLGCAGHTARFAPDLAETVAWGDERYLEFRRLVEKTAREQGLDVPAMPDCESFDGRAPTQVDLRDVATVLFTGGFRPDYRSWLPWRDAFDADGFPLHREGESTLVPGLWFVGVHFLRTRKSSLLAGVGEDAALLAEGIAAR
jgi:putative flavoprotein involved in K+ transport